MTAPPARRAMRIAVDIGGTFTDLQVLDEHAGTARAIKTPTTPEDPAIGLMTGIGQAARELGFALGDITMIMHGTTIATNAVLQRRLPKGALLTTAGFEDVIEIGRHFRRDVYASRAEARPNLVPRRYRFGIRERMRASGEVETPLDTAGLDPLAERLRQEEIACLAVTFLHAYANPEHEHRAAEHLRRRLPDLAISLSHEISPEIREFERTSTTVLNALLMPVVGSYLARLRARLAEGGCSAPVFLVQSNGGVMTPEAAAREPARLLLSGPSGGALAAELISKRLALPDLVAVDMGGTSYDVSVISGGAKRLVTEGVVDGLPVRLPMIEIRTIGSGGGSIARIEESGRMRVGPESAGARPGPACYGRGGSEPTVTDANVVLARIDPDRFLGGAMRLDAGKAAAVISGAIAGRLSVATEAAAEGMTRIAVSRMAAAIRLSLFEKGLDPEDFTLLSFGGASGLHACDTAAEIGIGRVVLPRDPGTLSAAGMLHCDIVHALARAKLMTADERALAPLKALCAELAADGRRRLDGDGIARERQVLSLTLDMRYPGQAYEIAVPLETPERIAPAVAAFHAAHQAQYAHAEPHVTPEIVTVRLNAIGRLDKPREAVFRFQTSPPRLGTRRIFADGAWREAHVVDRSALDAAVRAEGPLILEEAHATHYIPAGWRLAAAESGDLIATRETLP